MQPLSSIQGSQSWANGDPQVPTILLFAFDDSTLPWDASRKAQFKSALQEIEKSVNIRFFEYSDADISLSLTNSADLGNDVTHQMQGPSGGGPISGRFNADLWTSDTGGPGGAFFGQLLQAMGQALGLGMVHDTSAGTEVLTGVSAPQGDTGDADLGQGLHTVMSLNSGWYTVNGALDPSASFGGNTGLGSLDIAALQAIYGANAGGATAGHSIHELAVTNTLGTGYRAVWDTNGADILRYSGSANATLDLRTAELVGATSGTDGGYVSFVEGVQGGVTLARGTVIETAEGGSGDDTLIGSSLENTLIGNDGDDQLFGWDGDDRIFGGAGADELFGGNGTDAFVYDDGLIDGDTVYGGSGTDVLDFITRGRGELFALDTGTGLGVLAPGYKGGYITASDVEYIRLEDGSSKSWSDFLSDHILREVETQGDVHLYKDDVYYAFVRLGVFHNIRHPDSGVVGTITYSGWNVLEVEDASASVMRVLWQHYTGAYSIWTTDDEGLYQSQQTVENIVDWEEFFESDLNQDGVIGHWNRPIEDIGDIGLYASTRGYYVLQTASTTLILRDQYGAEVGPQSYPGWAALQAEEDGTGGFRVLWHNPDTDAQFVWSVDAAGQRTGGQEVSNIVDWETTFDADLNDDGVIGHWEAPVDQLGDVELLASTQGYFLLRTSSNTLTLRSGDGAIVTPQSTPGWVPIQAEEDGAGGFQVLWYNASAHAHYVWTVDATGQRTGGQEIDNIVDWETAFEADLNDDGFVGHWNAPVEQDGNIDFLASTHGYYLLRNGTAEIVLLGSDGGVITPQTYPGWAPVQAEEDGAGGYLVLWQGPDRAAFVWSVDAAGLRVDGQLVSNIVDWEASFDSDLNNDGFVGHWNAPVEEDGNVALKASTYGHYVLETETDIISLRADSGALVGPDTYPGWIATQVESNGAGGFLVLWQGGGGAAFVWNVSASGQRTNGIAVTDFADWEAAFEADLNADGQIGHFTTPVEQIGNASLLSGTSGGYILRKGDAEYLLRIEDGTAVGSDSFAGWSAQQAAANLQGGFWVLWQNGDGSQYLWVTDALGQRIQSGPIEDFRDYEVAFGLDLNGDGLLGHPEIIIENDGDEQLIRSGQLTYVIRGGGMDMEFQGPSGLPVGPDTYPGWFAVQAVQLGSGEYRVMWQSTSGVSTFWRITEDGVFDGSFEIDNVVDWEETFETDLNNDGVVGHTTYQVEQNGAISLSSSTRGYYTLNTGPSNLNLRATDGSDAGPQSYLGWEAIQVEADGAGGYHVLWHNPGAGTYFLWTTDGSAQRLSGASIYTIEDYESYFEADLNGDGTVGHATTALEQAGDVELRVSDTGVYVLRDGATELTLRLNPEVSVGPATYPGWTAVQVEKDGAGGYHVLWQSTGRVAFVWGVDAAGQRTGGQEVGNIVDWETTFEADLNDDGVIGHWNAPVEQIGDVELLASTQGYYVLWDGGTEITLLGSEGTPAGPASYPGWTATQAEEDGAGGYYVLWQDLSGAAFVWGVDAAGQRLSGDLVTDLVPWEPIFGTDLNGDGHIGDGSGDVSGPAQDDEVLLPPPVLPFGEDWEV